MFLQKIKDLFFYKKITDLYRKYERFFMPATLAGGFVLDVATFKSIDVISSILLLFIYIVLVAVAVIFLNINRAPGLPSVVLAETGLMDKNKYFGFLHLGAPVIMQFGFGALLSMSFIFYYFGGTFSVSWPLVLTILFLMISNEIFKEYYKNSLIQLGVFFWCLITLLSISFPIFFNSLNPVVFMSGGIAALLVMQAIVFVIAKSSEKIKENKKRLTLFSLVIFILMNIFYFTNIIPPIPLSLRDGGVYHGLKKTGSSYELSVEQESWWQKIIPGKSIKVVSGSPVYVYTAVFSPADLNTKIVHRWQKYDDKSKKWLTVNKAAFAVVGGRFDGYRGYSLSNRVLPGRYRVYVETPRGQILGKISFTAKAAEILPDTEIIVK